MNKAPNSDRSAVWDVDADTEFTKIGNLIRLNESGEAKALREGEIGKIFGLSNYYSQDVYVHERGSATEASTPVVADQVTAGLTTMNISGIDDGDSLKKGDLMKIGDYTYVVKADTSVASSNEITGVTFYPAAPETIPASTSIEFPDAESEEGTSVRNVGFHKNAFAFVTRALALPSDADGYCNKL